MLRSFSRALLVTLTPTVLLLACGSPSSSPASSSSEEANPSNSSECSFTACGGDVTGTWFVDRENPCLHMTKFATDICGGDAEGVTVDSSGFFLDGTTTFSADGTYYSQEREVGHVDVHVTDNCLQANHKAKCSELSVDADCSTSFLEKNDYGNCICRFAFGGSGAKSSPYLSDKGTWSTGDGTLTTTNYAATTRDQYCVQGKTLWIRDARNGEEKLVRYHR